MDFDKIDTKNRILYAALDLVGRQSKLNFTTREIAKKADVNLASINYYFRSKENLLNEIVQYFEKETNIVYQELCKNNIEPKIRIINWANKTMENLIEYPGILFMLATKLIKDKGNDSGVNSMVENLKINLQPTIKEYLKTEDNETVCFKATQVLSGVITPILIYHAAGRKLEFDITSKKTREKYISSLIDSLL